MIFIIIISAIINRIRGGLLDKYLPKGRNDDIAAVLYGIMAGLITNNILLALGFAAAFRLGEAPAWGHWVGVAIGDHHVRNEKSKIDLLLKNIKDLDAWAMAGLTIRGMLWGICLAVPAYFLYWQMAIMYVALGGLMGGVYRMTRAAPVRTGMRWGMAEYVMGALWGLPLVYAYILT